MEDKLLILMLLITGIAVDWVANRMFSAKRNLVHKPVPIKDPRDEMR